jgi:hypothetical protein
MISDKVYRFYFDFFTRILAMCVSYNGKKFRVSKFLLLKKALLYSLIVAIFILNVLITPINGIKDNVEKNQSQFSKNFISFCHFVSLVMNVLFEYCTFKIQRDLNEILNTFNYFRKHYNFEFNIRSIKDQSFKSFIFLSVMIIW